VNRLRTDDEILWHLRADLPVLDVRAPIEFEAGSLPSSTNLPLLDDDQRAQIGTVYKQEGSERAVALGHQLISGDVRAARATAWSEFLKAHPQAAVMCFRGGQRSQLVQKELARLGFEVPLIEGGFKRVRALLTAELVKSLRSQNWMVLSGFTGSGKTELLREGRVAVLDLEKAARHRGSVFGTWPGGQPSPVTFENTLGLEASRLMAAPHRSRPTWIEDESRSIGRLVLPLALFETLSTAKVWVLERPRAERAQRLTAEYLSENYGFRDGRVGDESTTEQCRLDIGRAIVKIERRLGGNEAKVLLAMTDAATREFSRTGSFSVHWAWVERMLENYYDPLYEHHLAQISDRVIGRGPEDAFRSLEKA
jgi:tRNA 2-selenouridine synthase